MSAQAQQSRDVTAKLVTALVLSRLDYCNAVLAGLPASTLAPFQRVLHAAARTVLDLKPRDICDSSSSRFAMVTSRREGPIQVVLAGSQVAFGTHAGIHLRPLTPVAKIPGQSALRTSSRGDLVVPRTRRRIGDRAFSVAAPLAWNRLPTELKLLRSTDSFRRDLKTFLFNSVYGHQDTD